MVHYGARLSWLAMQTFPTSSMMHGLLDYSTRVHEILTSKTEDDTR